MPEHARDQYPRRIQDHPSRPAHPPAARTAGPAALLGLQHDAGNAAVQRLLAVQRKTPARVPLGGLSGYRTAAQDYIGDYNKAAQAGLENFQASVGPTFDWGLFATQAFGNMIWALACFVSGGAAFLVSMGGIGITTLAAGWANVNSPLSFRDKANKQIDGITEYLNNQVDRVTREVYKEARQQRWDDNRARTEILRRLVRPEYIGMYSGKLPNIDTAAISAMSQQGLLVEANATQPRVGGEGQQGAMHNVPTIIRQRYTGYVLYSYQVGNIERDEGLFHHNTMNGVAAWQQGDRSREVAMVPAADVGDVNTTMNKAQDRIHGSDMHISEWPCKKAISLYTDQPEHPMVVVRFSEANAVVGADGWGVVKEYLDGHDPIAFGQRVATWVWGGVLPPDVKELSAPPELYEPSPVPVLH